MQIKFIGIDRQGSLLQNKREKLFALGNYADAAWSLRSMPTQPVKTVFWILEINKFEVL